MAHLQCQWHPGFLALPWSVPTFGAQALKSQDEILIVTIAADCTYYTTYPWSLELLFAKTNLKRTRAILVQQPSPPYHTQLHTPKSTYSKRRRRIRRKIRRSTATEMGYRMHCHDGVIVVQLRLVSRWQKQGEGCVCAGIAHCDIQPAAPCRPTRSVEMLPWADGTRSRTYQK